MANLKVQTPSQVGHVLRAVRKVSDVRLEDIALLAGMSKQTVQDIEHGKPTAQIGKVMTLLQSLGVRVDLVVPREQAARVSELVARLTKKPTE
jgi:transcriptional regulator with XRE-family HTH domain